MSSGKRSGSPQLISREAATHFLMHYAPALEASPAALATFTLPGAKTRASRDITFAYQARHRLRFQAAECLFPHSPSQSG
jgi:hypothetical protein